MIKLSLVKKLTLIFAFIACLFSPIVFIDGAAKNLAKIDLNLKNSGYLLLLLVPLILLVTALMINLFIKKKKEIHVAILFISIALLLFLFLFQNIIQKWFQIDYVSLEFGASYYALVFLTFIALFESIYVLNPSLNFTVRDICEIGILVSAAIILDFPIFKIRIGQNGGSISFAMLPLFILCLRRGFLKGFIGCGIVYGLITCLLDGYGLFTFPFDYLFGFGSLAVIACFNKFILKKTTNKLFWQNILFLVIGCLLSISFRLLFATLSGIVFYNLNFISSLIYQVAYILPSGGICLAILLLLLKPLISLNTKK